MASIKASFLSPKLSAIYCEKVIHLYTQPQMSNENHYIELRVPFQQPSRIPCSHARQISNLTIQLKLPSEPTLIVK